MSLRQTSQSKRRLTITCDAREEPPRAAAAGVARCIKTNVVMNGVVPCATRVKADEADVGTIRARNERGSAGLVGSVVGQVFSGLSSKFEYSSSVLLFSKSSMTIYI
jgi:hypothetical protein